MHLKGRRQKRGKWDTCHMKVQGRLFRRNEGYHTEWEMGQGLGKWMD